MSSVTCPSCEALFEVDFEPGTEFECGECGAAVRVPKLPVVKPLHPKAAPEPAAPPKIAPKAKAPGAAAAPGPAKTTPSKGIPTRPTPKPPVDTSAAPKTPATRPTPPVRRAAPVAPAAPEAPAARPPIVRHAAPTHGHAHHGAAAHHAGHAHHHGAPGGKKKPVVPIAIGGVIVLAGVIALVVSQSGGGGAKQDPATVTPATPKPRANPEEERYAALEAKARGDGSLPALLDFGNTAFDRFAAAEKSGDAATAKRFRTDWRWAYQSVIQKDADHKLARERLGDVLFDTKALSSFLEAPWISRDLKDSIELAADTIQHDLLGDKEGRRWLSSNEKHFKEWAELMGRVEKARAADAGRKSDPFTAAAESLGAKLNQELSTGTATTDFHREGVEGPAFSVFVYKPYVLLVQRDRAGGELDIAERWATSLEDLQRIFYERIGTRIRMDAMNKPTPIVVFRDSGEYAKYIRKDDSGDMAARPITSGAHFEPWSNRLVCYLQTQDEERTTLFHEGTHQIVEYAMNTAGSMKGMAQSLWFSEGIADFFGGHGKEWDEANRRNRYLPGAISSERLAQLAGAKAAGSLFTLRELLDYRRTNYQRDQMDPTKRVRVLNGYSQGWGLCYLLQNWKGDQYGEDFLAYVKEEFAGRSGLATFEKIFGKHGLDKIEKEFLEMIDELVKADQEGRIVNGKVLPKK